MNKIEEFLSECERREKDVTPGPWYFDSGCEYFFRWTHANPDNKNETQEVFACPEGRTPTYDDAQFICQSRTALPRAVAALRVAVARINADWIYAGEPGARDTLAEIERILTGDAS